MGRLGFQLSAGVMGRSPAARLTAWRQRVSGIEESSMPEAVLPNTGIAMEMRRPCGVRSLASTVARCRSATRLTSASPSQQPPGMFSSARQKRSNSLLSDSGGTPGPLSSTSSSTQGTGFSTVGIQSMSGADTLTVTRVPGPV